MKHPAENHIVERREHRNRPPSNISTNPPDTCAQQSIPIRRMLTPATVHTIPATTINVFLPTPNLIIVQLYHATPRQATTNAATQESANTNIPILSNSPDVICEKSQYRAIIAPGKSRLHSFLAQHSVTFRKIPYFCDKIFLRKWQ